MVPRIINILLGLWLMAAPDGLGYPPPARTNDHIVGPLIVSFAMIALSEATRPIRWINLTLGLWLLASPMLLGYEFRIAVHSMVIGLLVASMASMRGTIKEQLGGGWGVLWRGEKTS
jgi:hypothetical protein